MEKSIRTGQKTGLGSLPAQETKAGKPPLPEWRKETGVDKSDLKFPAIWHDYYPRLSVYLRRVFGITAQEDIEELIQEILLKVYRNLDRYNKKYALSTWVYRIARNCSIDFLRKKNRRKNHETLAGNTDDAATADPEGEQKTLHHRPDPVAEDFLKKEEREAVRRTLYALHREDRHIVFLRYYEELSYREIGKVLKLPEGTVKSRFHRVRGELRSLLKEVL